MKKIYNQLLLTAVATVVSLGAIAQDKTADEVKQMLDTRNYVFKAQMANPLGSVSRQLTSEYDLTVTRDTVISFLPYFGRAYSAPINPSEGGIKFTSTKFDYNQEVDGRRYSVTIKPKDASEVQQLHLEIFDNGRATLQVVSTNRQAISFTGYIEKRPGNKKAF